MPDTSDSDAIAKRWISEAQDLWQVQESLLQNYRAYLIVLNSLLAAGSCTIMVSLYSEIVGPPSKLNVPSLKFFLILIMIVLLLLFTVFAFRSINLMARVISNRGYNVHLCQYVIIQLQLGKFFRDALPGLGDEVLAKMSLLSAFKTVEHPEKHERGFVCIDKNHARLRDYLWCIKDTKCRNKFDQLDFTRGSIYRLLKWMFIFIWLFISSFWLLALGWLICRSTDAYCLLHLCHLLLG
jgi:hypothetical protein